MTKLDENNNQIVVFEDGELKIDVNVESNKDTVWLNRQQISELFDRDIKTIGKHINNVLKEELDKQVVVAKFATTTQHGALADKTQTKMVEYYNLDMIISVGYRVKSQRGIQFRRWATQIIKDFTIKGYTINEKRMKYLEQTIEIQNKMIAGTMEIDIEEVSRVTTEYFNALKLLDDYDHQDIEKPRGNTESTPLNYEECRLIIDNMSYSDKSEVFGIEKESGKLKGILEQVHQNVFGQELYPTLEEKSANLLYFIIKDHPFADGCKRIGATLFLEFLNKNKVLYKADGSKSISESALVAITLMIAQSDPKEKELMIRLIMNFLHI